jgi:hypothetical protein
MGWWRLTAEERDLLRLRSARSANPKARKWTSVRRTVIECETPLQRMYWSIKMEVM